MATIPRWSRAPGPVLGPLAVVLALGPLAASQVRPVNLEQMTERATTIFAGRCLATETVLDDTIGHEVTVATFEVDRAVKGRLGRRVSVRMFGGDCERGGDTAGMPRFRPGEEVVLFLYAESELGFSAPVGLGQGRFRVVTDKLGRRIAFNDFANRNLLRDLTPAARGRLASALGPALDSVERKDLEAPALLDMAETLVSVEP